MLAKAKDWFYRFLHFLPMFLLASILIYGIPFLARNFGKALAWVQSKFPPAAPVFLLALGLGIAVGFYSGEPLYGFAVPILAIVGLPSFYLGEEKTFELEQTGLLTPAGGTATFKAPLNYLYKEFFMTADVVLTQVGGAVPVFNQDANYRTAGRLIVRNGKKDLINGNGRSIGYFNEYENRMAGDMVTPAPAVGVNEFLTTWNLRCYDAFAKPEIQELEYLRSWAMSKLEVEFQAPALADVAVAGAGGALAWTNAIVRCYATIIEVSDKQKIQIDKQNKLAVRLGWDQEVSAGGFAADHQYRTSNLNRDGSFLRLQVLHRNTAAPLDVRADALIHGHLTWREKPITPLQIPAFFHQQITSGRLRWNAAVGMYLFDADTEGNHIGMPIPGSSDDLSFWYTAPIAVGQVEETLQQSLVAAGYDK